MPGKSKSKIEDIVTLIEGDERLKKLFAEIGVFFIDYEGKKHLTNDLAAELNLSGHHTYEQTWTQFVHPEDRKRVEGTLADLVSGKSDSFREVYRMKDPGAAGDGSPTAAAWY